MSFVAKMRLKAEEPVYVLNCPAHLLSEFSEFEVKQRLPKGQSVRQAVLFAANSEVLNKQAPVLFDAVVPAAMLWIAHPKKSGSIPSDLHRDACWEIVASSGWDGVASIAIDGDWSGMRFRHSSVAGAGLPPIDQRKTEGIDYINRKVTLPKDISELVREFPGLEGFFYTLSFSCQKEYVEFVVEAKKQETRQRRTDKMIEMMIKLREEKELKAKRKAK